MKSDRNHTGYLLLLTAGMILFAHAIFPHHHHNNQAGIEKIVCWPNEFNTTHQEESDHHHDDESHGGHVLNQLIILPANQWKQDYTCTSFSGNPIHDLVLLNSGFTRASICSRDAPRKPVPETSRYSVSLTASLQLRAPPVI